MSHRLNFQNRRAYMALMRVDRPIGTYLVVWPALWALWIAAEGFPELYLLLVFLLGAFLMRSAGCVINDYADRNIDGQVERTKLRPLATQSVSEREALQLFALLIACAACLLLATNLLTSFMALIAVTLTSCYPFMKRYTQLPQVVLGMAFSMAVPMAFAAQSHQLPIESLTLYLAVVFWVVSYDTFYAMVDRDDDLKIGVKSTAILFGPRDRMITAALQAFFIALLVVVGIQIQAGLLFFLGVISAALLAIYQQWLIRDRQKTMCFRAFLNNNYVGFAVFAGIVGDYIVRNSSSI